MCSTEKKQASRLNSEEVLSLVQDKYDFVGVIAEYGTFRRYQSVKSS